MSINFYAKSRGADKGDIEISAVKTGYRCSIDKNIAQKIFKGARYVQIGFDDSVNDEMYFIASDMKKGFKLVESSPYRDAFNITGKVRDRVKNFVGSFTAYPLEGSDDIYLIKKRDNGIVFSEKLR